MEQKRNKPNRDQKITNCFFSNIWEYPAYLVSPQPREDELRNDEVESTTAVNQRKFNFEESWAITLLFLKNLWEHRHEKLSPAIEGEFKAYLQFLDNDPTAPLVWHDNYKIAFGKILSQADLLTQEEIFTAMTELTASFSFKYPLLVELTALLYAIRYHGRISRDLENKRELGFWQDAIQRISSL